MRARPTATPTADSACPWWTEDAALGESMPDSVRVDCCVVGAGYAGLACARRLAEERPEWTVAVIDALAVGQGAAGRNSGFVIDTGHWQPELGADGNRAQVELARHGIESLAELVKRHEIACDWDVSGRHHVAVNPRGRAALDAFAEGLTAMGEPFERLDGDEVSARLGTAYYTAGLLLSGGALVQPAALIRGLSRTLPDNVRLFERAPVVEIERGDATVVRTESGRVECSRLVLATNGFVGSWGIATGRVLPLVTFASMTGPVEAPAGSLPQWGAVPEERMGSTMRRTADGRILVRNGVVFRRRPSLGEEELQRMRALHRESFEARFPELSDHAFEHTWGGVLGVSINNGVCFGSVNDGAWVCAGFNGVGIAMGTALGDLLAHEMLDMDHALLAHARALPAPGWLPPSPFVDVGLRAYTGLLQVLAGSER